MTATLFKFPTPKGAAPPKVIPPLRQAPMFEAFDPESSLELHLSTKKTYDGAVALVDFVRKNRDLARQAGVETIAIELTAIMAGEKFRQVLDALDDSVFGSKPLQLTTEGTAVLRTVETLLSEASANLRKQTSVPALGEARKPRKQLAAASEGFPLLIPLLIFGVLSLAGLVLLSTSTRSSAPAPKP